MTVSLADFPQLPAQTEKPIRLAVEGPDVAGRQIFVLSHSFAILGRGAKCDIRLGHPDVSYGKPVCGNLREYLILP